MRKTNSAKMSMEVKVEVLDANLKSLGRSFDTHKEITNEKLDDIKETLSKHVDKDESILVAMQSYVDARHEVAMTQGLKAEKKIDNAILSMAGGLLLTLITVFGYMWTAKENDHGKENGTEQTEEKGKEKI